MWLAFASLLYGCSALPGGTAQPVPTPEPETSVETVTATRAAVSGGVAPASSLDATAMPTSVKSMMLEAGAGGLSLIVTKDDGTPVTDVVVTLTPADGVCCTMLRPRDEDPGSYELANLRPGSITLHFFAEGYHVEEVRATIRRGGVVPMSVELRRDAAFTPHPKPVTVVVTTDRQQRIVSVEEAVTLPDGSFVSVRGQLVWHDVPEGDALLCTLSHPSAPRTCFGEQILVEGFPEERVPVDDLTGEGYILDAVVTGRIEQP
jgi:hypothetical protein